MNLIKNSSPKKAAYLIQL